MKRIYFMKPIGMPGPIKIGCSCFPESRLKALDIWSPFQLELLTTAPANHTTERNLHWRFRDSRLHGEWFEASPELLKMIAHVSATGAVPPLEASPYGKTGKGRGNNGNRNPAWKQAKSRLTVRVGFAEQHAFGGRYVADRPQRIRDLIASYQGAFTPPPEPAVVAEIEAYIAELRARPKCTTTWLERREARLRAAAAA